MARKPKPPLVSPFPLSRETVRPLLKNLAADPDLPAPEGAIEGILSALPVPGEHLSWLVAYDLDPAVCEGASTVLLYAFCEGGLPEDFVAQVKSEAAPILLRALQSPNLSDSRKYALGPLYTFCADDVAPEDFRAFFKDFDGISAQVMANFTEGISGDPHSIEQVMSCLEVATDNATPPGAGFMAVFELARHAEAQRPEVAAALHGANLISHWYEGAITTEQMDAVLGQIQALPCPEALWILEELKTWPGASDLAERAGRAAAKLRLQGREPGYRFAPEFSHGLITCPDGSGSRQLALFYKSGARGGLDAVLLLLNDLEGLKAACCIYKDGERVEAELRESLYDLPLASCNLARGRELLGDVWAFHEQQGKALPAQVFICRPYLGVEPIVARRRTPDLGAYRLDDVKRTPALVKGSDRLMNSVAFADFSFTSQCAYDFLHAAISEQRYASKSALLAGFLEAVDAAERDVLLGRMAATLEVEHWADQAHTARNRLAARTWLALAEGVVPFRDVPYVRSLGRASISIVATNLNMGFTSQQDANAAALEADMFGDEDPEDQEGAEEY